MDAQGRAVITWIDDKHLLYAREFSVNGGFGPARLLSPNQVFSQDLAMDAAGDAFITWRAYRAAQTRVLEADGTLTPIQTVSPVGYYSTVEVDADGNAVYAWGGNDGGYRIQARRRASNGDLGPVVNVSSPTGYPLDQSIALDARGNAVIAWKQTRLRTRTLRVNGTLSGIQPISPPKEMVREPWHTSDVAVDPAGNVIYAWTGSAEQTFVRVRSSGGLGRIQRLSPPGDSASASRLAALPTGGAVVLWAQARQYGKSQVVASFGP